MKYRILVPFLAALALSGCSQAHAASCGDEVDSLAAKYHVSPTLPSATPGSSSAAATNETLAQSGGVIAPPPTGDMASASPPAPNPEPMQTAPAITPQTATGETAGDKAAPQSKTKTAETAAVADSQAASLLQAARAADGKGDEATCRQRLADARALLEKTSGDTQ